MKKKAPGRILILIVILLVIVLAVAGVLGSILNPVELDNNYHADLQGMENAVFARAGKGIAAANEVVTRLYSETGKTLCSTAQSYPAPLLIASDGHAAVWAEAGTELTLLHGDGSSHKLTFPEGIISAALNDDGWIAVLAGESGHRGSVNVFRPDGSNAYRVYLGSSYPIAVAILPGSDRLAILALTGTGTRVLFYDVSSESVAAEWESAGCCGFALHCLSDGRLLLLTEDAAYFLGSDGRELGKFSYADRVLKACLTEGACPMLLLGSYGGGSTAQLCRLNSDGTLRDSMTVAGDVLQLSASGDYLAIRCSDRLEIYDREQLLASMTEAAGICAAFVREDGSAILLSGSGAGVFAPG